jgi:hypothetical protein
MFTIEGWGWAIKGSWTQKASKHLKEEIVKRNKRLHESGRWKCAF